MELSKLAKKEVINFFDGTRLGVLREPDLLFDGVTGEIVALILPVEGGFLGFLKGKQQLIIPWEAVKRIGPEILIVDFNPNQQPSFPKSY